MIIESLHDPGDYTPSVRGSQGPTAARYRLGPWVARTGDRRIRYSGRQCRRKPDS